MKTAVILAGGKGTRLAAISGGLPKPLVPLAGKPMIAWQLELLARYGFSKVLLTTGYRADAFPDVLGDGSQYNLALEFIEEAEPLGTAGGVAALKDRLNEPFLVMYGDVMVHMDLERLITFHEQRGAAATLVVHPNDHPFDSDLLAIDAEQRITALHPKPRPDDGPDLRNLVSAALYALSPEVFDFIEPNTKQDFVKHVFGRMLRAGRPMFAYNTTEYLKDVGTPERLQRVASLIDDGTVFDHHRDHTRATVFLDRDGVLNEEIDGVANADAFRWIDGAPTAIRRLNRAGFLTAVVTNQPGIAKGFFQESDVDAVHRRLEVSLGQEGGWVDRIVYCPHHPERGFDGERPELKIQCTCRKPGPGMLERLAQELPVDKERSVIVGDSWRDIVAGHRFGVDAIGVRTGHGLSHGVPSEFARWAVPDVVVDGLGDAVRLLIDDATAADAMARDMRDIVLIAGLSQAGKTTLAWSLKRGLLRQGRSATIVHADDWLIPRDQRHALMSVAERYRVDELKSVLPRLLSGVAVEAPGYNALTGSNGPPVTYGLGHDVLIIEGVVALLLADTFQDASTVFVDVPNEIRAHRLHALYAPRGLDAKQTDALISGRQEEHETIAAMRNTAQVTCTSNAVPSPATTRS